MRIEEALERLDRAADEAAAQGSLIFHLDLATEAARAALRAAGLPDQALAAWVDGEGYGVVGHDDAPLPAPVATVRFAANGAAILARSGDAPPAAATLARARRVIGARLERADDHAIVVMPGADPMVPVVAVVLALARDADDIRLDGHAVFTLTSDGRRILSREPLRAGHAAGTPPSVPILHDGAVPAPVHTYLSLKHGTALTVATSESGLRWRVDGERSARIERVA